MSVAVLALARFMREVALEQPAARVHVRLRSPDVVLAHVGKDGIVAYHPDEADFYGLATRDPRGEDDLLRLWRADGMLGEGFTGLRLRKALESAAKQPGATARSASCLGGLLLTRWADVLEVFVVLPATATPGKHGDEYEATLRQVLATSPPQLGGMRLRLVYR